MEALWEKDDNLPEVERVRKVLRVSYDGLEPDEKEMFRDASTLFQKKWLGYRGEDNTVSLLPDLFVDIANNIGFIQATLEEAKAVWAVKYKRKSKRYWQTLVDKALVYHVPKDSPIQLHEHLKDLGESLSKREGEVVEVYHEDEMDILLDPQRLRTPEMWQKIRFVNSVITLPRQFWHTTQGESMRPSNLEYLCLDDCGVDGERVVLPSTLLVLCGYRGSAHNLCLANCKRLVFLMLDVQEMECLPFSFEPFANLVRLHLSSTSIRFFPEDEMAKMRALQELRIKCPRLQKLPESLGSLCQLHIFVFEKYDVLKTLPESFGSLARLHTFVLTNCYKLGPLPESFGSLSLLRSLTIWGGEFEALPGSLGCLKGLEILSIGDCDRLVTLRIGSLTALQRIRMSLSSVRTLPETFGDLQSLRFLEVEYCDSLETLPDSFGGLHQLMTLSLIGLKSIQTLPATFGNLRSLQILEIRHCRNLKVLPDSFGSLEQLRSLKLCHCYGLQALPDTLGRLPCLLQLTIEMCRRLETLPDSLGKLRVLRDLTVICCKSIQALPDSVGSLERLRTLVLLECDGLQALPDTLGRLPCLLQLSIEMCGRLETLPGSLGSLRALQHLWIDECIRLRALPDTIGHLSR